LISGTVGRESPGLKKTGAADGRAVGVSGVRGWPFRSQTRSMAEALA